MPIRQPAKRDGREHHPAEASASAADFLPKRASLTALRKAAETCEGCPLFRLATQAVFGEGPAPSDLMLIGETPGDQEDRQGRPFVGPAGRLLDEALSAAGLKRETVYITNAVKHFKWEERGKRRLHKKPSAREIAACRPWLEAEIRVVRPRIIVCLGATAAQTLIGSSFRITKQRGVLLPSAWSDRLLATHHPSAALRAPLPEQRHRMRDEIAKDLARAAADVHVTPHRAQSGEQNSEPIGGTPFAYPGYRDRRRFIFRRDANATTDNESSRSATTWMESFVPSEGHPCGLNRWGWHRHRGRKRSGGGCCRNCCDCRCSNRDRRLGRGRGSTRSSA